MSRDAEPIYPTVIKERDYQVVTADSLEKLTEEVKALQGLQFYEGRWRCTGGVTLFQFSSRFAQAMVFDLEAQ